MLHMVKQDKAFSVVSVASCMNKEGRLSDTNLKLEAFCQRFDCSIHSKRQQTVSDFKLVSDNLPIPFR